MLTLGSDERILMVLRRHWWVMVSPILFTLFLLIIPAILVSALPSLVPAVDASWEPVLRFFTTLYFLGVLLFAFILWMNYYLDVWIITNERVIDIEQRNLFSRVISEIPMERIQNVSIEIHGVVETLLKFGDITVQTAGHREPFMIPGVPDLYQAKDLILYYARERLKDHAGIAVE